MFLATSRFCISASFPLGAGDDEAAAADDGAAAADDDDDASCWVGTPVGYSDAAAAAAADAAALRLAFSLSIVPVLVALRRPSFDLH